MICDPRVRVIHQMEENPRRDGTHGTSRTGPSRKKKHRYPVDDDDGGGGDEIKCSGRHCRSCTAGMIADCVALCCCPCAVVNILALAFLKVPWTVGRRCLGIGKKKGRKCEGNGNGNGNVFSSRWENVEEGTSEIVLFGDEEEEEEEEGKEKYSARFEAEKVWLELYQVGHLGFGRVSFNGIQSLGKSN